MRVMDDINERYGKGPHAILQCACGAGLEDALRAEEPVFTTLIDQLWTVKCRTYRIFFRK